MGISIVELLFILVIITAIVGWVLWMSSKKGGTK
jgi:hypothetical protein